MQTQIAIFITTLLIFLSPLQAEDVLQDFLHAQMPFDRAYDRADWERPIQSAQTIRQAWTALIDDQLTQFEQRHQKLAVSSQHLRDKYRNPMEVALPDSELEPFVLDTQNFFLSLKTTPPTSLRDYIGRHEQFMDQLITSGVHTQPASMRADLLALNYIYEGKCPSDSIMPQVDILSREIANLIETFFPRTEYDKRINVDHLKSQGLSGEGITIALIDYFNVTQLDEQKIKYGSNLKSLQKFCQTPPCDHPQIRYADGDGHGNSVIDILTAIAPRATILPLTYDGSLEGIHHLYEYIDQNSPPIDIINRSQDFDELAVLDIGQKNVLTLLANDPDKFQSLLATLTSPDQLAGELQKLLADPIQESIFSSCFPRQKNFPQMINDKIAELNNEIRVLTEKSHPLSEPEQTRRRELLNQLGLIKFYPDSKQSFSRVIEWKKRLAGRTANATLLKKILAKTIFVKSMGNTGQSFSTEMTFDKLPSTGAGSGPDAGTLSNFVQELELAGSQDNLLLAANLTPALTIAASSCRPGQSRGAQKRTIALPANAVYTASAGTYESGTSYAAPMVAATAALLLQQAKSSSAPTPNLATLVTQALREKADHQSRAELQDPQMVGQGLLNGGGASALLQQLLLNSSAR